MTNAQTLKINLTPLCYMPCKFAQGARIDLLKPAEGKCSIVFNSGAQHLILVLEILSGAYSGDDLVVTLSLSFNSNNQPHHLGAIRT